MGTIAVRVKVLPRTELVRAGFGWERTAHFRETQVRGALAW